MGIRGDIPLRIHFAPCRRHADSTSYDDHGTEADLVMDQLVAYGVPVVTFGADQSGTAAQRLWTPAHLSQAGIAVTIASDHPVVPVGYLAIYAGLNVPMEWN